MCVPFFPLTYLALSVPAPQADGNMAPWLREPPLFRFFAVGVAKMMAIDDANIFKATKHFLKLIYDSPLLV